MDPKISFRALARKRKVIGSSFSLTLSNFTLSFFWWQKKLHRPCASSANYHKLAFLGHCSKFVFPIKAQPNNFFQILFQQCNNTIFNYEPNFKEISFGKVVSHFFFFYVARWKWVFWPPFCNRISDFRFFCCILVLLDYFINGPHFTANFIRESTFLS